jgi:uncharacterized protein YbjT (DUF2867 family)
VPRRIQHVLARAYEPVKGTAGPCSRRQHFQTEEYVRATGLAHTFLRSSAYLDFVPYLCQPDGVIRGPGGRGRFAPVGRDDVADVVAAMVTAGTVTTAGLTT